MTPRSFPLLEDMVAALGYEAIGFDQSATALEAFRVSPDRFDLVLTDDIIFTGSPRSSGSAESNG
jgi:hypothetical protein